MNTRASQPPAEWHSSVMGAPSTSRFSASSAAATRVRYQSVAGRGVRVPLHQLTTVEGDVCRPQSVRPTCVRGWSGRGGGVNIGTGARETGMFG